MHKTYFKSDTPKKRKGCKITVADTWFSRYIRLRDIVSVCGLTDGYIICITCGTLHHWKDSDCGHYMPRDKPMTRFHKKNAHAQCHSCNRFKGGEQSLHGKAIDFKYGEGTSDKLIALSKIRGQKIHSKLALKDIAKEFRLKAKAMAKEKGVTI